MVGEALSCSTQSRQLCAFDVQFPEIKGVPFEVINRSSLNFNRRWLATEDAGEAVYGGRVNCGALIVGFGHKELRRPYFCADGFVQDVNFGRAQGIQPLKEIRLCLDRQNGGRTGLKALQGGKTNICAQIQDPSAFAQACLQDEGIHLNLRNGQTFLQIPKVLALVFPSQIQRQISTCKMDDFDARRLKGFGPFEEPS